MPRRTRYGWVPDVPDRRDRMYSAPPPPEGLPTMVNLRPLLMTNVYNQGELGSCTANAIGHAMMMCLRQQDAKVVTPSRLFIYYNEREMEGSIREDAGAQIRDGIKSVAAKGVCPETIWPYDVKKFAEKPPRHAYDMAMDHQVESYSRVVHTIDAIKTCLAYQHPIVFGIALYESFESREVTLSGNVPMPDVHEVSLGGHAITAVGYNDGPEIALPSKQVWPAKTFLIQNSWGTSWGLRGDYAGCFTLPYEYVTDKNLADDFWTVKLVESH